MTALEAHIANLAFEPIDEWDGDFVEMHRALASNVAAVLCADPTLRAIIDLADSTQGYWQRRACPPEVRALLADWRAQHAE